MTHMQTRGFWQRYRERRHEAARLKAEEKRLVAERRAEWLREAARQRAEAKRLKAERLEKQIQLLKKYGDVVAVSVGVGIIAAVVCAIGTHLTRGTYQYAYSLDQQGYPPLWVWAGVAAALATVGILFRRR